VAVEADLTQLNVTAALNKEIEQIKEYEAVEKARKEERIDKQYHKDIENFKDNVEKNTYYINKFKELIYNYGGYNLNAHIKAAITTELYNKMYTYLLDRNIDGFDITKISEDLAPIYETAIHRLREYEKDHPKPRSYVKQESEINLEVSKMTDRYEESLKNQN
jgi:hypothetical protein